MAAGSWPAPRRAQIDHLVVVARSLDEGAAWCEATLGVVPGPGGAHPLMGTHNRLLRLACAAAPNAYLEIIAIDPQAAARTEGAPPRRWFDMDSPAVQQQLAREGPQLLHFVAGVADLPAALQACRAMGIERGEPVAASRMTPHGRLQWQISVRDDGQRLFDGALPALIEWRSAHPATRMAASGITLASLCVQHPRHAQLQAAFDAIGLQAVAVAPGPPQLDALLLTPRGPVHLRSPACRFAA